MARQQRTLTVANITQLSPHLIRFQLTGASLSDFPTGFEGGYVKLVLPEGDNTDSKPSTRSFTIRDYDDLGQALTLDVVDHGDTGGPAANWVQQASVGESIDIVGPGACQSINPDADWFLLAGDMSALPAISVNLERLPDHAIGYVVLEATSEADCVSLAGPAGVKVHWLINPDPNEPNSKLEDYVMSLPWIDGDVSVWVAGEFSASSALRRYFRHEKAIPKANMYVSCYWKIGANDEGMKAAKKKDPETWA